MKLDVDEEILQDFLLEVDDMLAMLTDLFIKIESEPSNADAISELYRSFHTIKGGAGFLDLKPIVELCHKIESVFSAVKSGKKELNQQSADIIVSSYDVVVKMIEEVKAGSYPEVEYAEHVEKLASILEDKPEPKVEEKVESKPDVKDSESIVKEEEKIEEKAKEKVEKQTEEKEEQTEEKSQDTSNSNNENSDTSSDRSNSAADSTGKKSEDSFSYDKHDFAKAKFILSGTKMNEEILDDEFLKMLDAVYGDNKGPTAKFDKDVILNIIKKKKEEAKASKKSSADKYKKKKSDSSNKDSVKEKLKANSKSKSDPKPIEEKKEDKSKVSIDKPKTTANTTSVAPNKPITTPKVQDTEKKNEDKSSSVAEKATKSQSAVDNSIRIDSTRLDEIMNMVGELVLVRNRLVNLKDETSDKLILEAITNLDVVTSSLQSSVMQTRMQSVKKLFSKFPRIIRDLAKSLNKDVSVEILGETTELDKSLIDSLSEPMVHLVRNAVDHGLEGKDERVLAKKSERCLITLKAEQKGDHAYISITDDGRGISKKKVLEKARKSGVVAEDENITDEGKIYSLIFAPGFSTAEAVTDISGRGVGMDIVKNKIESLNGELQVYSKEGQGTTFKLKLPLTLAILPTLMVSIGHNIYALPLSAVAEIINRQDCDIEKMRGEEVLIYRGKTVPICNLSTFFGKSRKDDGVNGKHIIIVNDNNNQLAFVVDSLEGQEEVVIKPFNELLRNIQGFSGVTITGTGRLAIIIDVQGLVKKILMKRVVSA